MKSFFFSGMAAILLAGCASHAPLKTVDHVDLKRYSGRWYEIARYPNRFQEKCAGGVTAEYTPQADGTIKVTNSCITKDGERESVTGRAKVVPDTGNARLKVSFFGPFYGSYDIIGLAKDYSWALVGHPSRDYLWILARHPSLSESRYQQIVNLAVAQGYDASRIQRTKQKIKEAKHPVH